MTTIIITVTAAEYERLKSAAAMAGMTVEDWCRDIVNKAADEVLSRRKERSK